MTDSKRLREWIEAKGYKLKAVAAALNITPAALAQKIGNKREFRASEIAAFVYDLGMTTAERDKIFFAKVVN